MSRILLVDDELFLLEALHMLLRRHRPEWSFRLAPGSAEAIDALAAEPADVVVSDLGMPGMDGAALLEHVSQAHPTAGRLLLSGLSAAELQARGAIAHVRLQKPCDTAQLCAAIEQTLAPWRLRRATNAQRAGPLAPRPEATGFRWAA